jgi:hypothetical protein
MCNCSPRQTVIVKEEKCPIVKEEKAKQKSKKK